MFTAQNKNQKKKENSCCALNAVIIVMFQLVRKDRMVTTATKHAENVAT